ncbi:hypothetical protein KKB18_05855 [bacterium]|nr:hypothetical protein [bacterium]
MTRIAFSLLLLLFSISISLFANNPSYSETIFNPDIPIELDNCHDIYQLFYSQEDNLDGFTLYIENIKELKEQGIREIYLHLYKSDFESEMLSQIKSPDTPHPDISLSKGRSIGQTFTLKNNELKGFYLPFGTFKKSNYSEILIEIFKLDQPIYGEFQLINKAQRLPIGELCSKKYIDSKSILKKYEEFFRSLLNKPPNLLHYSMGELFTSRYRNLCGIEILLGTYNKKNKGTLKFYIKEKGVPKYITNSEINLADLEDNKFQIFSFMPIPDSYGKQYYFFVESSDTFPGYAISGYTTIDDYIPDGKLYINHIPYDSDLIFRPIYSFQHTKAAEPTLPFLGHPFCTVTLNPSHIKDNCFVFVDLSGFNLPLDTYYYMEVVSKESSPSNAVTIYSTSKNIYSYGSKFVDRKSNGGDLLFIPIYTFNHLPQRQILTAIGKMEKENSNEIKFSFPTIRKSMNTLYSFSLSLDQKKSGKIKIKTKPIKSEEENCLYTANLSTGRSFIFSPSFKKSNFPTLIANLFLRLPIDKPAIFTKGYFIFLYTILSLASITIILFIFFTYI